MNSRPVLFIISVSLLTAILCSAIVLSILLWDTHKKQRHSTEEAIQYWERYVIAYYQLYRSWDGISDRISTDLPRFSTEASYSLLLVDPFKQLIYQSDASVQDEPDRILLHMGTPIASMALTPYPTTPLHVQHIAVTVVSACLIFTISLFFGLYMERHSRKELKAVLMRIKSIHSFTDNDIAINSDEPPVFAMLRSIEGRLFRLENLRKSMVADFAHELRTPLAIIRAQLDNALQEQTSMPPERIVLLHDEIYRMSKLIKDLQDLVLAEAGTLHLDYSWLNLSQIVQQVAEILAGEAEARDIRMELKLPENMFIYADRARLLQVWINLVGNAIQHARSLVEIQLQHRNASIVGTINDDGMGIEEEDIPHLFDRFYRAEQSRANKVHVSGLGLGLAIAKQYVEVHQGTLSVISRWNEGASFVIELPVIHEQS